MAAPFEFYRDPALVLLRKQEQERSCQHCIYNARWLPGCLNGRREYPKSGKDCPKFKHRHRVK